MRIAFIGQKGLPATYGGVEKHVEELGARLAERGYKISAYTGTNYNNFNGYYRGMKIIPIPSIPQKHTEMISRTFFSLLYLLNKEVDIVHIHSIDPAILSFIPRLNSKVVVTSHGQAYRREKWGPILKKISELAERAYVVFPNKRISVSKTLKKYYQTRYSCEVVYIPNGANVKVVNSTSAIEKLGLSANGYVLFVGRIIPTKGCGLLIKAFEKVRTDKKLVVAGGGSYTHEYVDQLKRAANKNTIFLGYRYGKELEELYANAYCCVVPSEIEGLAISLLEAMSFGKCVICSDIPENLEVAKGTGIMFRSRDVEDLTNKLKFVVKNPLYCEERGAKAREHIIDEYNWDRIVDQTEEVYHSLL